MTSEVRNRVIVLDRGPRAVRRCAQRRLLDSMALADRLKLLAAELVEPVPRGLLATGVAHSAGHASRSASPGRASTCTARRPGGKADEPGGSCHRWRRRGCAGVRPAPRRPRECDGVAVVGGGRSRPGRSPRRRAGSPHAAAAGVPGRRRGRVAQRHRHRRRRADYVTDLRPEDFSVFEDGVKQDLTLLRPQQPADRAVAADRHEREHGGTDRTRRRRRRSGSRSGCGRRISAQVIDFDTRVEVDAERSRTTLTSSSGDPQDHRRRVDGPATTPSTSR